MECGETWEIFAVLTFGEPAQTKGELCFASYYKCIKGNKFANIKCRYEKFSSTRSVYIDLLENHGIEKYQCLKYTSYPLNLSTIL